MTKTRQEEPTRTSARRNKEENKNREDRNERKKGGQNKEVSDQSAPSESYASPTQRAVRSHKRAGLPTNGTDFSSLGLGDLGPPPRETATFDDLPDFEGQDPDARQNEQDTDDLSAADSNLTDAPDDGAETEASGEAVVAGDSMFVFLGHDTCRCARTTTRKGQRIRLVCGTTTAKCKRHQEARTRNDPRHDSDIYYTSFGREGHGMPNELTLTPAEMETRKSKEDESTHRALQEQQDSLPDEEEEERNRLTASQGLTGGSRHVSIGANVRNDAFPASDQRRNSRRSGPQKEDTSSSAPSSSDDSPERRGPGRASHDPSSSESEDQSAAPEYFCLEQSAELTTRVIMSDATQALKEACEQNYEVVLVTPSRTEAKNWKARRDKNFKEIRDLRRQLEAASKPDPLKTPKRPKSKKKSPKKTSPTSVADAWLTNEPPSESDHLSEEEQIDYDPSPKTRKKTRKSSSKKTSSKSTRVESKQSRPPAKGGKKTNQRRDSRKTKAKRKQKKRRGRSPSPSSSESLDSSEDDSSDSSDGLSDDSDSSSSKSSVSSEDSYERRHRRKAEKARKHRIDPSTGKTDKLYGLPTTGPVVDRAMGPDSLPPSAYEQLAGAAVDVLNLPGTSNLSGGRAAEDEEADRTAALLATVISAGQGRRGPPIALDPQWQNERRTRMQQIKDRESLSKYVTKLEGCETATFQRENDAMALVLRRRLYSESKIRKYQDFGLLPRVTKQSYQLYVKLLNTVRTKAYEHDVWQDSPAQAMIVHHTEKLMEVRAHAINRKHLLYTVYIYLRDAASKSFYHDSMNNALWGRLMKVQGLPTPIGGNGGAKTRTCDHCRGEEFHRVGRKAVNDKCPFHSLSKTKARAAASWCVKQKRDDPTKDIDGIISQALEDA